MGHAQARLRDPANAPRPTTGSSDSRRESPVLDELDHSLKITDGVLRFRIFKVDPRFPGDRAAAPRFAGRAPPAAARAAVAVRVAARATTTTARRQRPPRPRPRRRQRPTPAPASEPPPAPAAEPPSVAAPDPAATGEPGPRPRSRPAAPRDPGSAQGVKPQIPPFALRGGENAPLACLDSEAEQTNFRERADFQWLPASTGSSSPAT